MKTKIRLILANCIIAAIFGGVALGQVRQVQMGGAMDANPQVGSGGSNRPVPGYVPLNGNDIMTGNVSGLSYFHAPVGTVSQYQFRGTLGSASLEGFMRQSAGSPANGGTYLGIAQPYYLPSATVSTGAAGFAATPMGSGYDTAAVPRTAYSPLVSGAEIRRMSGEGADYGVINRTAPAPVTAGSPGALLASPIFVLRTTELPVTRPDVGVPSVPTTGPAVGQPALGPGEPGEGQTPENPAKIQGTVNEELQARLTGKGGELKTPMVSDTYLKVAAQIKTLQGIEAPATQRAETGLAAGGGVVEIDPLTGLPRRMALVPPTGGGGLNAGGLGATATQPGAAPPALPLTKVSDSELQAGGKVKPVRIAPQAGATVSGYDLLMNQAEKKLADGNYLDAAVQFQNALALKPDDPLALIGRAHAWLGAGVYAGADTDLKFAFTRNPELIGLRYQENSFVPAKRQEYLLDDLQKATEKKGMANMASFLYCYVCYETGRTDLLQAELKKWAAQPGHDEWAEVAARAWGGAK